MAQSAGVKRDASAGVKREASADASAGVERVVSAGLVKYAVSVTQAHTLSAYFGLRKEVRVTMFVLNLRPHQVGVAKEYPAPPRKAELYATPT